MSKEETKEAYKEMVEAVCSHGLSSIEVLGLLEMMKFNELRHMAKKDASWFSTE